ncbi:MAG: outer membrane beta-barrel protein [Acidobacteriota bacterium]
MVRPALVLSAILLTPLALPASAAGQSFGLGPRFSFVRGDLAADAPSTRFVGGTIRLRSSAHVALETALDYRAETSEDARTRLRERPLQASLLLFPVRSTISPYLLGGLGIYSRMTDTLDATGRAIDTQLERKSGWHFGLGAELAITRHAAFYADYRFRFVKFGDSIQEGDEPINIPGVKNLKVAHRGSMWTSGMAFYF